jgi:hypothetical protein
MLKKFLDIMVVILNTGFTEDQSPCGNPSFCMLVSSIVIEIIKYWIISCAAVYFKNFLIAVFSLCIRV